jgi:hypothetical protein
MLKLRHFPKLLKLAPYIARWNFDIARHRIRRVLRQWLVVAASNLPDETARLIRSAERADDTIVSKQAAPICF